MGPILSRNNTINYQTDFVNNITQVSKQNCVAIAEAEASGNVVVVSGSVINGGVGVGVQAVKSDAACTMTNTIDNSVQNIINDITNQTNQATTSVFDGFFVDTDNNNININNSVKNNISQYNETNCVSSAISVTDTNYVYVENSRVNGFVGVQNDGTSAEANCTMNNYTKNTTYNKAQNQSNQTNSFTSSFVYILGIVIVVIGVIVAVVIIVLLSGAFKFRPPPIAPAAPRAAFYPAPTASARPIIVERRPEASGIPGTPAAPIKASATPAITQAQGTFKQQLLQQALSTALESKA